MILNEAQARVAPATATVEGIPWDQMHADLHESLLARDAEIAALNARIDSWKRKLATAAESWQKECDMLEYQRDAAEDERIEWVKRGERAEAENEALKARLAEAEDECRRWQTIFADAIKGGKP